jgi:hypothetical protein
MTVSQFLDLAFAVLVDEHMRRGDNLFDALENMKTYAAGKGGVKVSTAGGRASQPSQGIGGPGEPATAADLANMNALATLTGAMKSVDGGFG